MPLSSCNGIGVPELYIAAIGNETAASSKDSQTSVTSLTNKVSGLFGQSPSVQYMSTTNPYVGTAPVRT